MPELPHKSDTPRTAVEIAKTESSKHSGIRVLFSNAAAKSSAAMGSPITFLIAIGMVILWAFLGPVYHYSDTWQLVINTGTSVATFLMVFLIQNTQNRDAKAIHLKLNELIHSGKHAQNDLIEVEKLTDEELKSLEEYYTRIRKEYERRCGSSTVRKGDDKAA